MNLDELKMAWKAYDERLRATEELNQELIASMIRERSMSRVSRIQRQYTQGMMLAGFYLIVMVSAIAGNIFDYTKAIEFLPFYAITAGLAAIMVLFFKVRISLNQVDFNHKNLLHTLEEIIRLYHQPQKLIYCTVILICSSCWSIPFTFLARRIEKHGLSSGLVSLFIPVMISAIIFFIAYKLGLFKDREGAHLKATLDEFNALKSRSATPEE